MAELIQFAVSLLAILALAWLVRKLQLGGTPRIADEAQAARLAAATLYGFEATETAIDKYGSAALLRDANNRVMLIFAHGSKFVGRLLTGGGEVRLDQSVLEITPTDSAVGTIRLELGRSAQEWAASLRRLNQAAGEAAHA